jgi:DNA-binding transcriptional LysR family regulator
VIPVVTKQQVVVFVLAEIEWVLREPESGTRSVFEAELARAGMTDTLRVVLRLPSNEAVRGTVEAGAGTTVLSASVVAPSLEAGLLHRVHLNLPAVPSACCATASATAAGRQRRCWTP